MEFKRGDIFFARLDPTQGAEQGKTRPVLVIQNDVGNRVSPTLIVAPITSKKYFKKFPTNVELIEKDSDLKSNATVLLNQIRTIDKSRIVKKVGRVNSSLKMNEVDLAIKRSLGLD